MNKILSTFVMCLFLVGSTTAQELLFTVRVNTEKLQTVEPKIFETFRQSVLEFLNNQKWTDESFETEERIECNIIITIQQELSPTTFDADIAIQSSRPVFNSSYSTPVFSYFDSNVNIEYQEFQPIVFSQNTYNDNLSSILGFYANIILGMDFDSFSLFGGQKYFQRAQDIVNNIPANVANSVGGWTADKSRNNRYWIIENLLSPRVKPMRQANYNYHRQGLDIMADNVTQGRSTVALSLDDVSKVKQAYPNCAMLNVFAATKGQEIIEIFKQAPLAEQNQVVKVMGRIDPSNASKYRAIKARG